jgi:Cu-processing system permease protein
MLQQFDAAALLGYTGTLFHRFFDGLNAALVAAGTIALWVVVPVVAGARLFHMKDF